MKRILFLLSLMLALPRCAAADVDQRCTTATTTVTASSAYASGNTIGSLLTFTKALGDYTGSGFVTSVKVNDLAAQAVNMDLYLFSSNPSATTITDKTTLDIDDADLGKVIVPINLGSSSQFAFNDNSIHALGSLFYPIYSRTSTGALSSTVYGVLVSRGTPTFASTSDISVTICVSFDSN